MPSNPNYGDLSVSLIVMSSQSGGTEQVVKHLATGLKAGGADIDITSISSNNLPFLTCPGVPVRAEPRLSETGAGYLRRLVKDVDVLRQFRGRTVNVHYPLCDLVRTHIAALRLAGIRDIFVSFHHPQLVGHDRQKSIKKALSSCRRLIVTTSQNKDFVLKNELAEERWVSVVLPGIEFSPQIDRAEARKDLGLPADKFLVGSLARLTPEKRIHLAMEACAKAGSDTHFVLGGMGSDQPRLVKVAEDLLPGRHTILGSLKDPNPFLASLDAFVLLSELEGFGLVYAEAAAQGVPGIGCDTGGTGTAIRDRETGYLLPVGDPVPGCVALLQSWMADRDACNRMGVAARNYVTTAFGKDQMAENYAKVFRCKK
jgi:glycosyltransferase involved in cell wall biosynthesis